MKAVIFVMIFVLSSNVIAKSKAKSKAAESKEDKPYRDPVPGGANADGYFYQQWRDMVQPQNFPFLPKADVLVKDKTDYELDSNKRKRYIFYMDVTKVDMKNEIWDEGYFHYAYSDKESGDFLLQVHPQYRKCFDDLTKKFDQMQWVVFTHGEIVGRKVLRLEKPRQCLGQFKYTGSKLPTAKSEFEP